MIKPITKVGPNSQRDTIAKLDGRGKVARRMKTIRMALIEALGGDNVVTPQQRLVIENITERRVRADMIFGAMMTNPECVSLENERRYYWHTSAIDRALKTLGLERRANSELRLGELLANGSR